MTKLEAKQVWFNIATGDEWKIKSIKNGNIRLVDKTGSGFTTWKKLMSMYAYTLGNRFTKDSDKVKVWDEKEGWIKVPKQFTDYYKVIKN